MGTVRTTAMVVGIIIGASIFVQPSQVTGSVPSAGGVLAVWLTAGLLTLIGALVIAELASAWPKTGGVYVYLRDAYSPAAGFLWGWAMFWTMHSGIAAVIAMVCARYVGSFVTLSDTGTRLVAMAAIVLLSTVNYLGVRPASTVQAALTFIKVAAIVVIIGIAFALGEPAVQTADAAANAVTTRSFVLALIAGLFTFGGWHMVSYAAEETIDPVRTIPRALLIGTLLVTGLYVALNAAYLYVLPISTVAASTRVAADLADAVAPGAHGGSIVSVVVILSTLGALNGVLLAGPRVYLAMANDGLLFRWIGGVHPAHRTPHRAILLQAIWSCVLIQTNTFRTLFTRVVYTEWIFFAMLAAALYFLRRRPGYAPAYKLRGYQLWSALFVGASAFIVGMQLYIEPVESAWGLLLVLSGVPVYLVWRRRKSKIEDEKRDMRTER
jgi:APA family basic amino acid/polyamine antiporter